MREFTPTTIEIEHPCTGRIALELFQLRLVESPDFRLVLQVPATKQDRGRVMQLIDDH
ncbi:MAG: hypothetical protein JO372_25510 [Solirubrobacterales bacterium]|nr:hypothetical protein [Solirubrobacterales bacterium]